MSLAECRLEWELGLTPLSVIGTEAEGQVNVVLQDDSYPPRYQCHRYFSLGDQWVCSVDGQDVPLEAVFSWLNDPSAATTQEENYIVYEQVG